MPSPGTLPEIESDYEVLETLGAVYDPLLERIVRAGGPQKSVRRWLLGRRGTPDDAAAQIVLMATATDLEIFTPSTSGKTALDRHLDARTPRTPREQEAFAALRAAQFRLVRIIGRAGPDLVRLEDILTQEVLVLLNAEISPLAAGAPTAMRLCPLASGRHVVISPLFLIDEAMLAAALAFGKAGRSLGHGHRCAANLYRDAARRGCLPMPTRAAALFGEPASSEASAEHELTEVQALAAVWLASQDDAEAMHELAAEVRRAASLANLVDACGCFGSLPAELATGARQAFAGIAELQMETLARRGRANVGDSAGLLDRAFDEIRRHVAAGRMESQARVLFERLRARQAFAGDAAPQDAAGAAHAELDRVIQRIVALRAKTVDQGCTEQEAMAAAAKVAELLDRYDLSLDEISVRKADCAGAAVQTDRRRRASVDSCVDAVAIFCDCRVWSEETSGGRLRYIYFGLKADVEAARFLHDLIEMTFETESAGFRKAEIYQALRGGDRRITLTSFQVGLARGIDTKLATLKRARGGGVAAKSSGFDLVAVKQSLVDEEMDKLGLNLTSKTASTRRLVHGDAYEAGRLAGAQFEPQRALAG